MEITYDLTELNRGSEVNCLVTRKEWLRTTVFLWHYFSRTDDVKINNINYGFPKYSYSQNFEVCNSPYVILIEIKFTDSEMQIVYTSVSFNKYIHFNNQHPSQGIEHFLHSRQYFHASSSQILQLKEANHV